ncbi:MAG: hypothetical protein LBQ12_03075, partial [Deltaproteobacteria bacterium]|nr:hypothetical protein [Deltaproteobacteria bacterium]
MRGRAAGNGGAGGAGSVMYARGLNWLGDAVISLPALAAAKRGWEGGLLVAARGAGAALYRLLPGAGEVLDDPRGAGNRLRLAGELRKRPIAMALLWQNSFSAALTALLAGIPRRAGWNRHGRRWLLTDWKDPSPEDLAAHEIFYHLKPVALAGMEAPFSLPALPAPGLPSHGPGAAGPLSPELSAEDPALPEGAHPALRAALGGAPGAGAPDGGFLLALAPGASYGGAKRWPAASFAQAARLILEGRRGSAVILGGAGEIEASSETERLLGGGPPCVNLAGKTGLGE